MYSPPLLSLHYLFLYKKMEHLWGYSNSWKFLPAIRRRGARRSLTEKYVYLIFYSVLGPSVLWFLAQGTDVVTFLLLSILFPPLSPPLSPLPLPPSPLPPLSSPLPAHPFSVPVSLPSSCHSSFLYENFGTPHQRHILRDRRPSTVACPACWPTGIKELK